MRSTIVEVTQNVDLRVLEKEKLATEAETRCKAALAKADEATAAHARALAAEAQMKEEVARTQALSKAEQDRQQAELTRAQEQLQEVQDQAQIEKTRAQNELRLALDQKDEQIDALQSELADLRDALQTELEAEKRRAHERLNNACTALNSSRQHRRILRVFFKWARQACVGAVINGIMVGAEGGNMSSVQSQQSTHVIAVRTEAEKYAKNFALWAEEDGWTLEQAAWEHIGAVTSWQGACGELNV